VTPVVPRVRVCCEVFDHNGDGFISKLELHRTMNELGVPLTREDLDAMMDAGGGELARRRRRRGAARTSTP